MRTLIQHHYGMPDGPPLVLLHGLTEAGTAWPDAVRRWGPGWHIVAPDQRGHGRSPRFTDEQCTAMLTTFVADAVDLLESLSGPAVVVGHSLGGRVATATALDRPDLVRALILEDPALADGTVTPAGFVEDNLAFLATFDDGIAAEVARMRTETTWTDDEILEWAACKPLVDRAMIARLDLGDLNRGTALNALRTPTLVLADADGPLAPAPGEVTNPLVSVEWLDGVSHTIRRDDPQAFHRLADPFLSAYRTG